MTVPPDEHRDSGTQPDAPLDFDPYRFGAPEHPVPAEYAPPGYRPPAVPREPDLPPTPPPPAYGMTYHGPQSPAPLPPGYLIQPGAPRSGKGKAVASMVLGIASILLCWLTFLDVVPVVLAVVFGIIALHDASRDPYRGGRAMAITGIICGAVGAVLAIVLTTWFVHLANQCGGFDTNSSQLQQCIRDHI
jgi:hypothetical protein